MTFIEAVTSVFQKYATFSGRATRSEYWWFALFSVLVNLAVSLVGSQAGSSNLLPAIVSLAKPCSWCAAFA